MHVGMRTMVDCRHMPQIDALNNLVFPLLAYVHDAYDFRLTIYNRIPTRRGINLPRL